MAQPRRVNLDEQAKVLSCTTAILADGAVTGIKLSDGAVTSAKICVDSNLDFHNFQALNFRIENLASDPTAGNPGRLIWRTDLLEIHVDNGTAFVPVTGGGGGANIALSNLSATAINQSLLPATNDTFNLGNISHVWDSVFARQLLSDTGLITTSGNLTVGGNLQTATFTLTTTPTAGYVLTSDINGNGTWQASTAGSSLFAKDFVTVANVVTDKTITLTHTPALNSEIVVWNGVVLTSHSGIDYSISGNVVTIAAGITLTIGDELQVSYSY